jgi:hypothetical protein
MSHHTLAGLGISEREDRVTRASRFERAHFLEVFALEEDLAARRFIDRLAGEDRCSMDVRLDSPGGGSDVVEAWVF